MAVIKNYNLLFGYLLMVKFADACSPPMNLQEMLPMLGRNSAKMFGDTNQPSLPINFIPHPTSNKKVVAPPLTDPTELYCNDFNVKCRWRNMEGLLVDELDFYQGTGFLDEQRLHTAANTFLTPEGSYGIVATDKIEFPTSKAILVSDVIECQLGEATLRFTHWTSPGVRLVVCAKGVDKAFPDYDYCSDPIEEDPGPSYVKILDLGGQPFQIYIRAENFVFSSPILQGGFAILDDIEYYGHFCPQPEFKHKSQGKVESKKASNPTPFQYSFLTSDQTDTLIPLTPSSNNSVAFASRTVVQQPKISIRPSSLKKQICENLNCTFKPNELCTHHLDSTPWRQSSNPIGDLMGGIPGDASKLPFNKAGDFAFIQGPQTKARFSTRPFTVDEPIYFMFAYYKSIQMSDLRVFVKKREDTKEEMIFEAPKLDLESHRWFREVRPLTPGEYVYIAFEVSNLPMALSIGVDELTLLDGHRTYYCKNLQ